MAVFDWTCNSPFTQLSAGKLRQPGDGQCSNVDQALRAAAEYKQQQTVFVFRDFDVLFSRLQQVPEAVTLIRRLKDVRRQLRQNGNAIIFVVSTPMIPNELAECMSLVEACLPDQDERAGIIGVWLKTNAAGAVVDDETVFRAAGAAAGMTSSQIQTALAMSVIKHKGVTVELIEDLVQRKIEAVRSTEVLEYVPIAKTLDDVGGLAGIKTYLAKRVNAYGRAAEAYGLKPPKGILLVGPPGCGKSLLAKVAANVLGFALIRLDVGKLHGPLVGQSDERMRRALALADSQAPCVLWSDEIEKGFAGVSGPSGDSGASQRVFGCLLTWMQERTSKVFVFATANNISRLPPEFLRKGRFDEIFLVDLPTAEERRDIVKVLLRRRGREHKRLVTSKLIDRLDRFSGAEMEAMVDEAMYEAFYDNQRAVTAKDLEAAAAGMVPIADQMRQEIESLRAWGKANARPANG